MKHSIFLYLLCALTTVHSKNFWGDIGRFAEVNEFTNGLALGSSSDEIFEPILAAWPSLPHLTVTWSNSLTLEKRRIMFETEEVALTPNAFDVVVFVPLEGTSPSSQLLRNAWRASRSVLAGRFDYLAEISLLESIAADATDFVVEMFDSGFHWSARKETVIAPPNVCKPSIHVIKPRSGISIPTISSNASYAVVNMLINCTCCNINPDGNYIVLSLDGRMQTHEEPRTYFSTRQELPIGPHSASARLFSPQADLLVHVEYDFSVTQTAVAKHVSPVPGIDHIFVCHWAPLTDRRRHIESSLSALGFDLEKETTWVTEYDRATMTREFIDSIHDASYDGWVSRWLWMTGGTFPPHRNLSLGEIGVTMCHLHVYFKIIELGFESVLVIEDDAVFVPQFKSEWEKYYQQLPPDWDFFMIGLGDYQYANTHCGPMKEGEHVCRKLHPASRTAGGYVVRRKAAVELQSSMMPFVIVSDSELQFQMYINHFSVYWAHPHLLYEGTKGGPFSSVVQPDRDQMQAIAMAREKARQ